MKLNYVLGWFEEKSVSKLNPKAPLGYLPLSPQRMHVQVIELSDVWRVKANNGIVLGHHLLYCLHHVLDKLIVS